MQKLLKQEVFVMFMIKMQLRAFSVHFKSAHSPYNMTKNMKTQELTIVMEMQKFSNNVGWDYKSLICEKSKALLSKSSTITCRRMFGEHFGV